jgi:hypothetical protein
MSSLANVDWTKWGPKLATALKREISSGHEVCDCGECGGCDMLAQHERLLERMREKPTPPKNAVIYRCKYCKSTDVRRNADTAWCPGTQSWVVVAEFDHVDCEKCEGETTLEEIPYAQWLKENTPRS